MRGKRRRGGEEEGEMNCKIRLEIKKKTKKKFPTRIFLFFGHVICHVMVIPFILFMDFLPALSCLWGGRWRCVVGFLGFLVCEYV